MGKIKGLRDYLEQSSLKDVLEIPKEERVVCKELAQGEYNINYVFQHPVTKKKMVLRVNTGVKCIFSIKFNMNLMLLNF